MSVNENKKASGREKSPASKGVMDIQQKHHRDAKRKEFEGHFFIHVIYLSLSFWIGTSYNNLYTSSEPSEDHIFCRDSW